MQATLKAFDCSRIDILISNAAVNPAGGPILQMDDGVIDKILEINVRSAIWLARETVRYMKQVTWSYTQTWIHVGQQRFKLFWEKNVMASTSGHAGSARYPCTDRRV